MATRAPPHDGADDQQHSGGSQSDYPCGLVAFGRSRRLRSVSRQWNQEPVAATSDGLYESRIFGGVPECIAQPANRSVETVIEVHESIGGPQAFAQLFPRHNFPGSFQQQGQDLKRLLLKTHLASVAAKLSALEIHFEKSEMDDPSLVIYQRHDLPHIVNANLPWFALYPPSYLFI